MEAQDTAPAPAAPGGTPALVVFHGFGHGPLARLFGRAGFRHCFVCLAHQGGWQRLDFQNGLPTLEVVCADSFDLASFYRAGGLTVVSMQRRARRPLWPLMFATCVGAAKKVLGVSAPFVLTPYQLHRYLTKEH